MENASKALLIAGAILIAIVLISLGVIILQQGQEVSKNANMSEAQIAAFNAKFTQFEGRNVRGSVVKQLYRTVLQNNIAEKDATKKVSIALGTGASAPSAVTAMATNATQLPAAIGDSGQVYNVACTYSTTTGLITTVTISK